MVNRFNCNHIDGVERDDENGDFVRAEDYDSLAARLALSGTDRGSLFARLCETEARLAEAERIIRKLVHDWDGEPDDIGDAQRWLTVSAEERPACDCKSWEACKAPLYRDCKRLTPTVEVKHE